MKIDYEDEPIVKVKGEKIEDFDPIIKKLKEKFRGK